MPRLRNAPATQQPAPSTKSRPQTRRALAEKTNTTRSQKPIYEDDGNTEGLVKDAKKKTGKKNTTQLTSDEFVMAGGLGLVGSEDARMSIEVPPTTDGLAKSDFATMPLKKPNKRPPRATKKVKQNEAQTKVLEDLKQRMQATAQGEKQPLKNAPLATQKAFLSSLDQADPSVRSTQKAQGANEALLPSSPSPSPPPLGKTSVVRSKRTSSAMPSSALRAQGTPAIESSMLALKNFKRRPRQPSMLQMVQQRTASARPSLANTRSEENAVEDSSIFDLDDGDDLDDFAPEAEGTPLNVRTRNSFVSAPTPANGRTSSGTTRTSRKRKSDDIDHSSSSLGRLEAKRQKSIAVREAIEAGSPAQQVEVTATQTSRRLESSPPAVNSEVEILNSPSTATTQPGPPTSHHASEPKDDEFVVPSTEPGDDELAQQDGHSLDNHLAQRAMADPLSSSPSHGDISAFPLTLISPIAAAPQPKKKKTKPMTSAMLQSLLPKKRAPTGPRHRRTEYDFESDSDEDLPLDTSHLDEDEDELGSRRRRRNRNAISEAPRGRPRKRAAAPSPKPVTRKSTKKATASKKSVRTYGRGTGQSDKENDDYNSDQEDNDDEDSTLPEISVSMQEAVKSKEIEEAKRKFADIDKWDMQFEIVSVDEHHRSSSQDWR